MQIHTLDTGLFKLDGGAMFGVVPKVMWEKLNPPDVDNLCTWAMRCLLIEDNNRLTLVDTGLGNKQDEKFRSHFKPHGNGDLIQSIRTAGYHEQEITDVFLTHMHFDHVGGAVSREGSELVPTFKNATYWTNDKHLRWALEPNPREKASFLTENIQPLVDQNRFQYLDDNMPLEGVFNQYTVNGHTEAMMLPVIDYKGRKLYYCADLIPSSYHIRMPYVMAYDVRPLDTLKEKALILEEAYQNDGILVFEHDPVHEACTLKQTDRGIMIDEYVKLEEL